MAGVQDFFDANTVGVFNVYTAHLKNGEAHPYAKRP